MITESEDMEEKGNSSVSAAEHGLDPAWFLGAFFSKEWGPSVPGGAHLSVWNMGHLFSPLQ